MKTITIYLFFLPILLINSQTIKLKGRVITEDARPVYGANIIVSGTTNGAAADENGYFEIGNINLGTNTLQVSAIGYEKKNITISVSQISKPITIVLRSTIIETDQIIISAGKYEQKREDLTVSTTVINPEYIDKQNFLTFDDMLRTITGVQMNLEQVSIRGSSGYSKGVGARVLVALNGIPLYAGDNGDVVWELIPLTDIERVEIIKGPASSLYGSSAIGGVINIITKNYVKSPVTSLATYYGIYDSPSYDIWKWNESPREFYGMAITHSNSYKNLGYTLSLKKFDNMSYRQNDFNKKYLGYLKLDYEFENGNNLTFFADYLNMNRGNYLYWKDSRNALVPKDEDNGNTVRSSRFFSGLIYRHSFNKYFNAEFKSSFYRTRFDGYGLSITSSLANLLRGEVLANYKLSPSLTLTSGTEISYSKVTSDIFSNTQFIGGGVYTQAEYKGIKNVVFSAGLRGDYIKVDSLEGAFAFTPRAGINYKVYENFIIRASVGTAFRAPTPAEIFTTASITGGLSVKGNTDLKAETSISTEIGTSYLVRNILDIDAALFLTKYKNYIEPNIVGDGIQFLNVPNAEVFGFESSVQFQLIQNLIDAKLGYMYLWARDPDKNIALKYRPRHSFTANLSAHFDSFEAGINFRFQSKFEKIDDLTTTLVVDGDKHVPIYVTDLMFGYNLIIGNIPVKVYLNAKNVFNYNYVEFTGNLSQIRNYSISTELYF